MSNGKSLTCFPSLHHCKHPQSAECCGWRSAAAPPRWSGCALSRSLQPAGAPLWAMWHSTSKSDDPAFRGRVRTWQLQIRIYISASPIKCISLGVAYYKKKKENILWFDRQFSGFEAQSPCPAFCQLHPKQGRCTCGGLSFQLQGSQLAFLESQCRFPHLGQKINPLVQNIWKFRKRVVGSPNFSIAVATVPLSRSRIWGPFGAPP